MDIQSLVLAVNSLDAEDAFKPRLTSDQWRLMQGFLSHHELRPGDLLARQDDMDRTVFFLEEGTVQVYRSAPQAPGADAQARTRIALARPGSILGEGGLFGLVPRLANVEAMTACKVWVLVATRWDELCMRQPLLAVEVLKAAGIVYASRMRMNLANHIAFS
jgi:CRP/FNR family transcriptional regulator, cyclic AMP receptor protein